MSRNVTTTVAVSSNPATGASFPTGTTAYNMALSKSYQKCAGGEYILSSAVDQDIFPDGFTKAQFIYIRVSGGTLMVKVTSGAGTAQVIPVEDVFLLASSQTYITALTVSGTGSAEVFVGGE